MSADGAAAAGEPADRRFQIFRGADAPHLVMSEVTGVTAVTAEGMEKVRAAGGSDNGADVRVLLEIPGFSLTYAWFKSGYPLPRHSHKMDCAYYIVGGSLQLGPDLLGKGDGFFVPADAPYAYTVGPQGVEVLEFRHDGCHDINIMAGAAAFWTKAAEAAPANRARWAQERRPSPTLEEQVPA
jgi:hypothetical protein